MLPRDSQAVERCQVSGLPSCLDVEFRAEAPDKFRFPAYRGKHSGEKEQVARLHRFRIDAESRRRRWKVSPKFS
jgi:hypothetical protein